VTRDIRREVEELQEWYERHWEDAEDISEEVLQVIERHTHEYLPFDVYAKALQEFVRGHEMTLSEWEQAGPENGGSHMFPVLDKYQQQGYQALMKIARDYRGAFLCDGVGLGKTYVGLMVIERLVMHDRKRVALFVPKSTRKAVWEQGLRRYLPHVGGVSGGDFSNLAIYNHTDLGRGGEFPDRFARIKELADAIVIDEAHHFRNPGFVGSEERRPSRYRLLNDLIDGPNGPKKVFMLTATPINNKLDDFRHMAELFTRGEDGYFASQLGIHSLRGHFVTVERALRRQIEAQQDTAIPVETDTAEAEAVLSDDPLFQAIVVQRSRAYVRKSQMQEGAEATSFPDREPPKVADYSVHKTYGRLLEMVDKAFHRAKPLFALAIYYPLAYYTGPDDSIDALAENRQKQVCSLIRTLFLKRFESSARAFEQSCSRLLRKLLAWVERHSDNDLMERQLERWKLKHSDLIGYVRERQLQFWGEETDEDVEEDIVTPEMVEEVEYLSRDEYLVDEMLVETYEDLNQVAEFLYELRGLESTQDDKANTLVRMLKKDPVLKEHKVAIFTEYADTARYLEARLKEAGIQGVAQVDSARKKDIGEVLRQFSPYYNGSSSSELADEGKEEIRVLISTDILSEGLNLQDATRLINYDLHWNPVRLMQRIGRVDRRMDPEVEAQLLADHPEEAPLRGKVAYWNFLPPDALERLLGLYGRVAGKTLRISSTLGIPQGKLLTEEDEYDALRDFIHAYEGTTTTSQELTLEFNRLLNEHPGLEERLNALPGRVFSGKEHPSEDARAVFFCYRVPRPDQMAETEDGSIPWTEEAGDTRWYLYDLAEQSIADNPGEIADFIRSEPDTPRHCDIERETLSDIRRKIDKHIKNTVLKQLQAPIGVRPILKAWMELN
jgi:superfamily II DNA or RNA helicase